MNKSSPCVFFDLSKENNVTNVPKSFFAMLALAFILSACSDKAPEKIGLGTDIKPASNALPRNAPQNELDKVSRTPRINAAEPTAPKPATLGAASYAPIESADDFVAVALGVLDSNPSNTDLVKVVFSNVDNIQNVFDKEEAIKRKAGDVEKLRGAAKGTQGFSIVWNNLAAGEILGHYDITSGEFNASRLTNISNISLTQRFSQPEDKMALPSFSIIKDFIPTVYKPLSVEEAKDIEAKINGSSNSRYQAKFYFQPLKTSFINNSLLFKYTLVAIEVSDIKTKKLFFSLGAP